MKHKKPDPSIPPDMQETDVQSQITELSEALDMVETELRWLLSESTNKDVQPNTSQSDELLRMFFSLYKDFLIIHFNLQTLAKIVSGMTFTDPTMGLVYRTTLDYLVRKSNGGIFKQFISVAENGCLPDGTTHEDLSS